MSLLLKFTCTEYYSEFYFTVKIKLLISFLLYLNTSAAAPLDDKIVGGYECAAHSQPWQVSINIGYHYCGGSLINDQWIISAAHCWQKLILHAMWMFILCD